MKLPYFNLHSHFIDIQNVTIFQTDAIEPNQWFSVGIHPWNSEYNDFTTNQDVLFNHPRCIAIGEIGLDKLKGPALELQVEVFKKQIALSEQYQLPVIIHCVKAWNELKSIRRKINPSQPWIFHGFSKIGIIDEVLNEGIYVSFGHRIMEDHKLLEAAVKIPLENIFFETDDHPIEIERIYSTFANAKQISLQELKEIQFNNFKRVFKKWKNG